MRFFKEYKWNLNSYGNSQYRLIYHVNEPSMNRFGYSTGLMHLSSLLLSSFSIGYNKLFGEPILKEPNLKLEKIDGLSRTTGLSFFEYRGGYWLG